LVGSSIDPAHGEIHRAVVDSLPGFLARLSGIDRGACSTRREKFLKVGGEEPAAKPKAFLALFRRNSDGTGASERSMLPLALRLLDLDRDFNDLRAALRLSEREQNRD
jgi:hypothetical protein